MSDQTAQNNQRMPKWLLFSFLGFFGVLFTADGFLVYLSQSTWSGLSTQGAYEKGLAYNSALSQQERQDASGWSHQLNLKVAGTKEAPKLTVNFSLNRENNDLIKRATVMATIVRPTHEGFDQEIQLPLTAKGLYSKTVDLPLIGLWEVRIKAKHHNLMYQTNERVTVHTGA